MPIAPAMAQADTCDNSVCCCRSSWAACSRSVTTGTPPNTICSICCFCRSSGWECGRATPAAGTTLTSLSYCGVLYLGGAIPADQFYAAMRHFWIGDTVGIITIIPAATSVFAFLSKARWRWSGYELVSCSVFILGTCLGFAVLFGVGDANEYHLFYLLFLSIICVGMREGYAGVAVALLAIQLGLIVTTTYVGIEAKDFSVFQMLMLVLSIAGLLLGADAKEYREPQAHSQNEDGAADQLIAGPAPACLRQKGEHGCRRRNDRDYPDCIADPEVAHRRVELIRWNCAAQIQHPAI